MTALNAKAQFTTCWATPYALVAANGQQVGIRPRTRRFFINEAVVRGGNITGYRGFYCDDRWRPTTNVREVSAGQLVKDWRKRPDAVAIIKAKKRLPIVEAA
jgi:hypothetical protein